MSSYTNWIKILNAADEYCRFHKFCLHLRSCTLSVLAIKTRYSYLYLYLKLGYLYLHLYLKLGYLYFYLYLKLGHLCLYLRVLVLVTSLVYTVRKGTLFEGESANREAVCTELTIYWSIERQSFLGANTLTEYLWRRCLQRCELWEEKRPKRDQKTMRHCD